MEQRRDPRRGAPQVDHNQPAPTQRTIAVLRASVTVFYPIGNTSHAKTQSRQESRQENLESLAPSKPRENSRGALPASRRTVPTCRQRRHLDLGALCARIPVT